MIKNPSSTDSQQPVLQALDQLVSQYPVCEAWIILLRDISDNWANFSQSGYLQVYQVGINLGKVFRYIQGVSPVSVLAYNYIGALAVGAPQTGVSAKMASLNATGNLGISLTASAVDALNTLQAWDDVLNISQPPAPDITGLQLVQGAVAGVVVSS